MPSGSMFCASAPGVAAVRMRIPPIRTCRELHPASPHGGRDAGVWCTCWAGDGKRRMELRSLTGSYMRRLTAAVLQFLRPCTWSCAFPALNTVEIHGETGRRVGFRLQMEIRVCASRAADKPPGPAIPSPVSWARVGSGFGLDSRF